jgi:hypothetical protein
VKALALALNIDEARKALEQGKWTSDIETYLQNCSVRILKFLR